MSDAGSLQAEWVKRVLRYDGAQATKTGGAAPSLRRLATCRLDWVRTCETIRSQVAVLQATIVECYENEPDAGPDTLSAVNSAVEELNNMVGEMDETLSDMLDDIINQHPGKARAAAIATTTKLADAYLAQVDGDPDFALIDDNEFYPTGLKSITKGVLVRIAGELQSVAGG